MHPDLVEAVQLHRDISTEARKALVGYEREKLLTNVALFSQLPAIYDEDEKKRVNAGNVLLEGVPGVGKTYFGVIIAAVTSSRFVMIECNVETKPSDIIGYHMINPATGKVEIKWGPIVSAEIALADEINRTSPRTQGGMLSALQNKKVTIDDQTKDLPEFSFVIATMNPLELGQGTFGLSDAMKDRFAIKIVIGYLPPDEEQRLVNFDFRKIKLNPLVAKERVIALRASIEEKVFLHPKLDKYIRRIVTASRPYNPERKCYEHSPSELVERYVEGGASPRATICFGRLAKTWALLSGERDEVYPEDIQNLAPHVFGHRIEMNPIGETDGISVDTIIKDVIDRVAVP